MLAQLRDNANNLIITMDLKTKPSVGEIIQIHGTYSKIESIIHVIADHGTQASMIVVVGPGYA